jgi:hypothetical protein
VTARGETGAAATPAARCSSGLLPPSIVKPNTTSGRPLCIQTAPGTPSMSASCATPIRTTENRHSRRALKLQHGRPPRLLVGAQRDVGIEHGLQRLKVRPAML